MVGIFITFKKKTSMFTVWGRHAHSDRQSTEACLYVNESLILCSGPYLG